jgi:hypothetical protein
VLRLPEENCMQCQIGGYTQRSCGISYNCNDRRLHIFVSLKRHSSESLAFTYIPEECWDEIIKTMHIIYVDDMNVMHVMTFKVMG